MSCCCVALLLNNYFNFNRNFPGFLRFFSFAYLRLRRWNLNDKSKFHFHLNLSSPIVIRRKSQNNQRNMPHKLSKHIKLPPTQMLLIQCSLSVWVKYHRNQKTPETGSNSIIFVVSKIFFCLLISCAKKTQQSSLRSQNNIRCLCNNFVSLLIFRSLLFHSRFYLFIFFFFSLEGLLPRRQTLISWFLFYFLLTFFFITSHPKPWRDAYIRRA